MFILGSQDAKLPPSVCLHVRTHACTHTCTYTPAHTHTPVLLGSFDTACFVPYLTSLQIPPACPSPTPGCPSLWPPPRRPGPRGRLDDRGCDVISPCRHRTNRCPRRGVPPLPFPARATWGELADPPSLDAPFLSWHKSLLFAGLPRSRGTRVRGKCYAQGLAPGKSSTNGTLVVTLGS